jgi:tetratricopeptide (TPR) repeat protein
MILPKSAFFLASIVFAFPASAAAASPVTLREVDEVIPTYLAGPPEPNPMFYFGAQSQGAEGRIYPYPLYDNLTNRKGEKSYHLIYLENEYVKIAIAPEIGGRLFSALDKTNGYDYIYKQHVIKPALIGLIGAWISGGIEWNIPHHHRASTFLPVQWRGEKLADGGKTVWVGELEVRHRMRWAVGYTLRPGSNVLECSVRIVNRTPLEQTMLCFANVAVTANENYQIIFPPSTQWVTYHGKTSFASWPIARQHYNGVDFTAGIDVSWYKNHAQANSMFAWNYQDDFFAGYDHGRQAGTMSIADHHIVPGKKFWTWGNGPRGRLWDDILTDTDGPYIELMVGAFSDNQPDYSWLQPFETRAFTMNWYPFRDIGGVKNANLDAAVNLEVKDGTAKFGFNTTREFSGATVRVTAGDKMLFEDKIAISPAKPYVKQIIVPAGVDEHDVRASLSSDGRELVAYAPLRLVPEPQPKPYTPPPAPKDIASNEELFLAGQRADQFHSPSLDADPFWEEALRRDPGDIEANIGMGRLALRRAQFTDAEKYFRTALARLTANYTTTKNAEPLYYLGVALKAEDKTDEAFDAFYKATWSQEWKSPAYFALGEIASLRGNFTAALEFADQAIDANALNIRAHGLKAAALRHLGRTNEAVKIVEFAAQKIDPLDTRLAAERWLANRSEAGALFATFNVHPQTAQENAAEYAGAGLWRDGAEVLAQTVAAAPDKTKVSPLIYYYLGDFAEKLGDTAQAVDYRHNAMTASSDYAFPFQSEMIPVLRRAMEANPQDARAPYYLGTLLFDWQPAEAIALWEKSALLDPAFPIAWRNLAQAYAHQTGDDARSRAIACLEKAVALPGATPMQFAELDHLYQTDGAPVEKRLAVLGRSQDLVIQKDEGRAALIALKTLAGRPDESIALLQSRTFSIWENGTQFNTGEAGADAHLVRALQRFQARNYTAALADFQAALNPPANLRAEQRGGSRQLEINYWIGCTHEALGDKTRAEAAWDAVASAYLQPGRLSGGSDSGARRGRNNALTRGAQRYYQALAQQKLGKTNAADATFRALVTAGTAALNPSRDDEAPRFPGHPMSPRIRAGLAHYLTGLGYAGLGEKEQARAELTAALASTPDLLGAKLVLEQL